jgi:predicted Zn-dependent protease
MTMKDAAFFELSDRLGQELRRDEVLLCNLEGEDSDFVRLNGNRVRQAGGVSAWGLSLDLIQGQRQAQASCDLSGDLGEDLVRARTLIERLRERLPHVPADPYLNYSTEPGESHRLLGGGGTAGGLAVGTGDSQEWDSADAVADIIQAAAGLDLVGIWASGELSTGFASSLGHRHWHASRSFNLDFSCYLAGDKAVKANLSGQVWNVAALAANLAGVRRDLEILARPPKVIPPGRYRAWLAPAAVAELLELLSWGGFGLKDHRTAQTPLLRLVREERSFDPRVTLREEHRRGLVPGFTAEGFLKPAEVTLIAGGRYRDCLVDSRSAKEFGQAVNAAGEGPESLALDPGDIPTAEMPDRLDRGLAIGNLWYLNYADRNDCRVTGMTRFATFWVENGIPVAPVEVMRFDDSLYHLLGDRLEGLSRERELIVSPETYEGRSRASALLPGLLVSGIDLAL